MSGTEVRTSTHRVSAGAETVPLTIDERGDGHPFLLLHGGGGPLTVNGFAGLLAGDHRAHVITPTHPGFGGTPRPDSLTTVRDLAALYAELLAELDLEGVTVVGNSIGGWIAAEMVLADPSRIGGLVVVDGVGIEVEGHPVADFFSLTPRELAERSYHDPDKYGIDPAKLPPEALKVMAGNRAAIAVYAGSGMADAGLAARLAGVNTPALVIWGEDDRIADPDYGRAFAASIPHAQFRLLPATGHMPQIESPGRLAEVIWAFASAHARLEGAPS